GWASDRDPIKILTGWLLDNKIADQSTLDGINDELTAQMDAAVEFAIQAPFPAPHEVEQDIYA
ncbi:MAG: ABC transporter substrate-binding protein, partial [Vicinamibacterales bacterium]